MRGRAAVSRGHGPRHALARSQGTRQRAGPRRGAPTRAGRDARCLRRHQPQWFCYRSALRRRIRLTPDLLPDEVWQAPTCPCFLPTTPRPATLSVPVLLTSIQIRQYISSLVEDTLELVAPVVRARRTLTRLLPHTRPPATIFCLPVCSKSDYNICFSNWSGAACAQLQSAQGPNAGAALATGVSAPPPCTRPAAVSLPRKYGQTHFYCPQWIGVPRTARLCAPEGCNVTQDLAPWSLCLAVQRPVSQRRRALKLGKTERESLSSIADDSLQL